MISFIDNIIEHNLPRDVGELGARFYLKLCTPASGRTLKDKVIFLVFKAHAREPYLCVKTVRNYEAKGVILRDFENLQKLYGMISHTGLAHAFPKPLYLHDDGEHVFSIEGSCVGKKMAPTKANFKRVVKEYVALQMHMAKHSEGKIDNLEVYVQNILTRSYLSSGDQALILNYFKSIPIPNITLSKVTQHGDLTFDNMVDSSWGVHFLDHDAAGVTDIPGFDLFGFCRRFYRESLVPQSCKEELSKYFAAIDQPIKDDDYEGLFFVYHLIEHLERKPGPHGNFTAEKIIANFEKFQVS